MNRATLTLTAFPADFSAGLKALRLLTPELELKQVKRLAEYARDHLPCSIAAGLDVEVGSHLRAQLVEAGFTVQVEESALGSPMLLFPSADRKYAWGGLGSVKPVK